MQEKLITLEIYRAFFPKGSHKRNCPESLEKCKAVAGRILDIIRSKEKPQADAGLVEEIKQLSESRYCQALDYAKRTECLGWEYKSKNGLFGVGEFKAHEKVNTLLGEHKGLHEAAVLLSRYHPAHSTDGIVGALREMQDDLLFKYGKNTEWIRIEDIITEFSNEKGGV